MPKAEVGSTKYVANKMKAKGLQRLRWYCQICSKQCRDENGFKQHTQSEGHVRAMLMVGEDARKHINDFSRQFQDDFVQLLKTSKNDRKVNLNNFYQEYIRDKEHIHMNATKWPSLTEFAKHLGREGVCRVEEGERGLEIQWIDDSAEAIRRREDIAKKDRQAKGDEELESRLLEQQIKRAREAAEKLEKKNSSASLPTPAQVLEAGAREPLRISMSLKGKGTETPSSPTAEAASDAPVAIETFSSADVRDMRQSAGGEEAGANAGEQPAAVPMRFSVSLGGKPKVSNPLAAKKNPLAAKNPFAKQNAAAAVAMPPAEKKKMMMSNAERIMREEIERKRLAEERGHGGGKRPRLG